MGSVNEEDTAQQFQTFVKYEVKKYKNEAAQEHPTSVVESRTLSTISPPEVTYEMKLMPCYYQCGQLSICQLEALNYACQAFERTLDNGKRQGFLLGDGVGMGKGRVIASVIYENHLHYRMKSVWVSTSVVLYEDAKRDIQDLFGETAVGHLLHGPNPGEFPERDGGCVFFTYATLRKENRMKGLIEWLGEDFDGVIALDECHSSNNEHSVTFAMVQKLNTSLPQARFLYCSATAAENPIDMKMMTRLGLWEEGFADCFVSKLEQRGLVGMESLVMELKAKGLLLTRRLDLQDSTFATHVVKLDVDQINVYDQSCQLWVDLRNEMIKLYKGSNVWEKREFRMKMTQYWGAHLRFFRAMCSGFKVKEAAQLARTAQRKGQCVVFGIQSTGECNLSNVTAKTSQRALRKLQSAAMMNFTGFVTEHLTDAPDTQRRLVHAAGQINLPRLPLDELIKEFDGAENVAELTGRRQRLVTTPDGIIQLQKHKIDNSTEQAAFMSGRKKVAIISDAASVGISLHSDRRAKNSSRRLHVAIELPWSAEKTVQQFGRTHRSNQASGPNYLMLVTDVAGEMRFVTTVARRMQNLGALTQGDRTGTISSLTDFALYEGYAHRALVHLLKALALEERPMLRPRATDKECEHFFERMSYAFLSVDFLKLEKQGEARRVLAKDDANVRSFMNRLLGIPHRLQNEIYDYFFRIYHTLIDRDRQAGQFHDGIYDLTRGKSRVCEQEEFRPSGQLVTMTTIELDRGMRFCDAKALLDNDPPHPQNGFYMLRLGGGKMAVYLALIDVHGLTHRFVLYKPHLGAQANKEDFAQLRSYKLCLPDMMEQAEEGWTEQLEASEKMCYHQWRNIACPKFGNCSTGKRLSRHTILSGALWSLLDRIEPEMEHGLQRVECKNEAGATIIGIEVPEDKVEIVRHILAPDYEGSQDVLTMDCV